MKRITLLYFEGCPSWKPALENLQKVVETGKIPVEIELLKIEDAEQAQKEKFLGSPSIQVDGIDLWPQEQNTYRISCRLYQTPAGLQSSPTIEMLRQRLKGVDASRAIVN